jgi:hypothetical protein
MKHTLLLLLPMLLIAGSSWGAEQATPTVYSNTRLFKICDAVSATGTCGTLANGTGNDLYVGAMGYNQFTVTFSQTGTNASCDVYIGDQDTLDAMTATSTLTATDGTKINSTSLSSASTAQSFEGPFNIMWVTCTSGTALHTVRVLAWRNP